MRRSLVAVVMGDQPVADAVYGLDHLRVAELGAQGRHVHVQGAPRPRPRVVPHFNEEPLARDDYAGLAREGGEQLELLAGQRDGRSVAGRDEVPGDVDAQPARGHGGARRRPYAAHDRVDAGAQLGDSERLDQVVVGPRTQADDPVPLVSAGGDGDDRHVAAGAQPPAHLDAVHVGQA